MYLVEGTRKLYRIQERRQRIPKGHEILHTCSHTKILAKTRIRWTWISLKFITLRSSLQPSISKILVHYLIIVCHVMHLIITLSYTWEHLIKSSHTQAWLIIANNEKYVYHKNSWSSDKGWVEGIKEKQTKRQKSWKKKETNKQQQPPLPPPKKNFKKKTGSAEAWTKTACVQGNLLGHRATEGNIVYCVKNNIFKAYFLWNFACKRCETSWSSRKSRNLNLASLSKY